MKQEEIERASKKYAYNLIPDENGMSFPLERVELSKAFERGGHFVNSYWEEKTRWKSLISEPPMEFGEKKRILIKHKDLEINVYFLYSDRSIEDALDMGFIEWKEID